VNLLRALGVGRGDVVALAGAGGKTTLAMALAREAEAAGLRVVRAATVGRGIPVVAQADIVALRESADVVIVESDGARGRLLKTAGDHEPLVPAETTLLVVCASLECLDRPLDVSTVHRCERVIEVSGREPGSPIDALVIARALAAGYPGRRPAAARLLAFLNAMEATAPRRAADVIAAALVPPFDAVLGGSAREGRAELLSHGV